MTPGFFRMAVVLGLITAVGPFAIDMYLPAMPSIGAELQAGPTAVQMTLMVFFIIIGACQLIYGPLADMYGRKLPIYAGLALFTAGSIGCALAPSMEALIAFRALQALGACAGMVIPRAIIRDLHTGPDATRLMSLLMLVVSVSPILAPLAGSAIIPLYGWRGVFWAITATALIGMALAVFALPETHPVPARADSSWRKSFAGYGRLFLDWPFMSLTIVSGLGMSSFFIYLGSSSFVLTQHYGLTPTQFSLCFAANAAAFIGSSQFTGLLTRKFGLGRVIQFSVAGFAAAMAITALLVIVAGIDSLWLIMAGLFIGYGFLGQVLPTAMVLAMEEHGANAGIASALMGALQMVFGALLMAIGSAFTGSDPRPMVAGIAACAVASYLVSKIPVRHPAAAAPAAPT